MYRPASFAEDDVERLVALMRVAGFGHLVVAGPDGFESTPMPFVVDDLARSVRAHLARPNGIWRLAPCDALLIVPVSDAYISPAWYPSKPEHGRVVPTWNYEVVHLHGRLIAHDEPDWVSTQIRDLTDRNERDLPEPWSIDDPPDGYVDQLQRGIVGVELAVSRVEGKSKLSQNRTDGDQAGAIASLVDTTRRGAAAVAAAMRATGDATS